MVHLTGTKCFLVTHEVQINSTLPHSYVKQIAHVAIAKTYTPIEARDVKKENQMKSSFLRGNLSMSKGNWLEESFYLIARKKINYYVLQ